LLALVVTLNFFWLTAKSQIFTQGLFAVVDSKRMFYSGQQ
jgi:hypothetical protein